MAPVTLADTVLHRIAEQTELARAGKPARIYAKMNALVDLAVIGALYQASQAGCRVDLCVRGICCLRPGLAGVSENMRVFSVVGRFLEHCRVFLFGAGEEEQLYLSSADWMPRNLHRRVELMFPVENRELRARIHREVIGRRWLTTPGPTTSCRTGRTCGGRRRWVSRCATPSSWSSSHSSAPPSVQSSGEHVQAGKAACPKERLPVLAADR